jgi:hypothetical protein
LAGTGVIHQLSAFYFYFSAAHAASFNKPFHRIGGKRHRLPVNFTLGALYD